MPWTAETIGQIPAFAGYSDDIREECADVANAVLAQELASGTEQQQAETVAIRAALRRAAQLAGEPPPPEGDEAERVPVGKREEAAAIRCDVAFRAVGPGERTVTYRGHEYIRGPYQPILKAGSTHQALPGALAEVTGKDAREIKITREHLGEMVRNAAEQSLIPVNFAHMGDYDIASGTALGLVMHDTVMVAGDYLYGRIAYTVRGAEMVRSGELPGISAEFSLSAVSKKSGKRIGAVLYGAGLLTQPQLHELQVITRFSAAQVSSHDDTLSRQLDTQRADVKHSHATGDTRPEDHDMPDQLTARLADMLKLSDTASHEDIVAAITAQVEQLGALTTERDKLHADLGAAVADVEKLTADLAKANEAVEAVNGKLGESQARVLDFEARAEVAKLTAGRAVPDRVIADAVAAYKLGSDGPAWKIVKTTLPSAGMQSQFAGAKGEEAPAPAKRTGDPEADWVAHRDRIQSEHKFASAVEAQRWIVEHDEAGRALLDALEVRAAAG